MSRHEEQENGGAGRIIPTIILIVSILVFGFAAYKLISIGLEYHKGTVEYNELAEKVEGPDIDASDRGEINTIPEIDFDTLTSINSDVIGWIRFIEPSVINYPIVYCSDNSYYLHRTFEKTYIFSGSIFSDMSNAQDFTDPNTIIYGHNMNNGSMFGELDKYKKQDFFEENDGFYILTPDGGVYWYRVIAFYETTSTSDSYTLNFESRDDYAQFQQKCMDLSMYDAGVEVNPDMPMLTLSTCTNRTSSGRYLLQAVLQDVIREGTVDRTLQWGDAE